MMETNVLVIFVNGSYGKCNLTHSDTFGYWTYNVSGESCFLGAEKCICASAKEDELNAVQCSLKATKNRSYRKVLLFCDNKTFMEARDDKENLCPWYI